MYEQIKPHVAKLESAYRTWAKARTQQNRAHVLAAHENLVQRSLVLSVESAELFERKRDLTANWSEIGTEAAAALMKACELCDRYDPTRKTISQTRRDYLLLTAATEYYRCGRHGVASAITKRVTLPTRSGADLSPTLEAARMMQAFAAAGPANGALEARESAARTAAAIGAIRSADGDTTLLASAAVGALAQAVKQIEQTLTQPNPHGWDESARWLDRALTLADKAGDIDLRLMLEGFSRAHQSLRSLSVWNIAATYWPDGAPPTAEAWSRHLIASGQCFLFPGQHAALLTRPRLSDGRVMVSLPTGGGKSFLAEFFALRLLAGAKRGKVIVVVPSRALAAEKSEDLRRAFSWQGSPFKVCQLTGEVAFDAEQAVRDHDIIVLTPEKLDILLRNNFYAEPLLGLVVDEFHTIRAEYRGLKLQLAVARFTELYKTPALFISAIVRDGDFQALGRWASSPDPFSSRWKPTPSRIGLVDLKSTNEWTVEFNDGTARRIPVREQFHPNATSQMSMRIVCDFLAEDQVLHFSQSWRGAPGENRLVGLAGEYIDIVPELPHTNAVERARLAGRLARLLGADHKLVKAYKSGIGVHWGKLPHAARRIMEEGIRKRALGLILSTSTLAEGVNLPLKTVVVPNLEFRRDDMDKGLFLNVVGRAGRPFQHPEGQVVLAYADPKATTRQRNREETRRARAERYSKVTSEDLDTLVTAAVHTARLFREARESGDWQLTAVEPIAGWEDDSIESSRRERIAELLAELESFSASLIAAIHENLITGISGNATLRRYLFIGTESPQEIAEVEALIDLIERRILHYGAGERRGAVIQLTTWGETIYRVGFGPEGCTRLRDKLVHLFDAFENVPISGRAAIATPTDPARRLIDQLIGLLQLPREFHKAQGVLDPVDSYLLRGWWAGTPIQEMANRHTQIQNDYLTAFTRIDGVLSAYAAWVFVAAHAIAEHARLDERRISEINHLARTSLYGHYERPLQTFLSEDFDRALLRDDAIAIWRSLGESRFRAAMRQGIEPQDVTRALAQRGLSTRIPEDEVGILAARLFERLAGRGANAE